MALAPKSQNHEIESGKGLALGSFPNNISSNLPNFVLNHPPEKSSLLVQEFYLNIVAANRKSSFMAEVQQNQGERRGFTALNRQYKNYEQQTGKLFRGPEFGTCIQQKIR